MFGYAIPRLVFWKSPVRRKSWITKLVKLTRAVLLLSMGFAFFLLSHTTNSWFEPLVFLMLASAVASNFTDASLKLKRTRCSSAKREIFNNFSFFVFLSCHSNYKNITRIAHSYRARKSMLECTLDCDEKLNSRFALEHRYIESSCTLGLRSFLHAEWCVSGSRYACAGNRNSIRSVSF